MRVHYDRRGRIKGYSGGIGLYYWFAFLELAVATIVFAVVILVVAAVIALALLLMLAGGLVALFDSNRGKAIRQRAGRMVRAPLDRLKRNRT